ncbi:ATP-binding protein [Jatrophihabitans fulvus]
MCRTIDASFVCEPEAVGEARRWVRDQLEQLFPDLDGLVADDVGLTVSELVTNCVRADGHDLSVSLTAHRSEITVAATDDAPGVPVVSSPPDSQPSGRGLAIVEAVTSAWGVESAGDGHKTVWGRFDVTGAESTFECSR